MSNTTREEQPQIEGEANHTSSSTIHENHEETSDSKEEPQLTDEEVTKKFGEAKALFNEDKYSEAADLFADVLNHKYVKQSTYRIFSITNYSLKEYIPSQHKHNTNTTNTI